MHSKMPLLVIYATQGVSDEHYVIVIISYNFVHLNYIPWEFCESRKFVM